MRWSVFSMGAVWCRFPMLHLRLAVFCSCSYFLFIYFLMAEKWYQTCLCTYYKRVKKRPRILGEGKREGRVDGWMDGWRLAGAVSLISLLSLLIHPRHADSSLPSRTLPACQVIHIPYLHSHQHHWHKETDMQGGSGGRAEEHREAWYKMREGERWEKEINLDGDMQRWRWWLINIMRWLKLFFLILQILRWRYKMGLHRMLCCPWQGYQPVTVNGLKRLIMINVSGRQPPIPPLTHLTATSAP